MAGGNDSSWGWEYEGHFPLQEQSTGNESSKRWRDTPLKVQLTRKYWVRVSAEASMSGDAVH
jgi:hypothetical protein